MESLPVTQREYQYLPKVKKFYYWILAGLVVVELVLIRLNYHKIHDERWYIGVIQLLIASSLPVSLFYRLLKHVHPLIHTRFSWVDKGIKLVNRKKERFIDFDQISSIHISRWPAWWGGGFTIRLKSGQVFHLLSFIEKGYEILTRLLHEHPEVTIKGPLAGYMKQAPYVSATWNRWRLMKELWHWFLLKHLAFPLIIAMWLAQSFIDLDFPPEGWLVVSFSANLFLSSVVYHIQEEWLLHKASQNQSAELDQRLWVYGFQALYTVIVISILSVVYSYLV